MTTLEIKNLKVKIEDKLILKGVNLKIKIGEIHAIMGPNGSGKSTLAHVIMGHPSYEVVEGEVRINGTNILELDPEERAKLGIFLAFQYPVAIPGVKTLEFLRSAVNNIRQERGMPIIPYGQFLSSFKNALETLQLDTQFMYRYLNEGFSGGEKKRFEIVQMLMLDPKFVILDEVDSGLDIDSVKVVAKVINQISSKIGTLIITHYRRILDYIEPHYVHVMIDGKIVASGGPELAHKLEEKGYKWLQEENSS